MVALLRDLSRRESRAWVLALLTKRRGIRATHVQSVATFGSMHGHHRAGPCRYLDAGEILCFVSRPVGFPGRLAGAELVPALAALDPNDPRPIPDGSRWVDARALLLVACHVAGVEAP